MTNPRRHEIADRLRAITDELAALQIEVAQLGDPPDRSQRLSRDPRLQLDRRAVVVTWKGARVERLTPREFAIVEYLASAPGRVRSRDDLLGFAWGADCDVLDRQVDSAIKRLRAKLRRADPEFDAIETLYGFGYAWRLE